MLMLALSKYIAIVFNKIFFYSWVAVKNNCYWWAYSLVDENIINNKINLTSISIWLVSCQGSSMGWSHSFGIKKQNVTGLKRYVYCGVACVVLKKSANTYILKKIIMLTCWLQFIFQT